MSDPSLSGEAGLAPASSPRPARPRSTAIVIVVAIAAGSIGLGWFLRSGPDPSEFRSQATGAARAGRWPEAELALNRLSAPTAADSLLRAVVAVELKDYEAASRY